MNNLVLFLGILLIILIYILYMYFTMSSTTLFSTANLFNTVESVEITSKPASLRYAYGIWIYVNGWDTTTNKVIFDRNENVKLYFDDHSPILKCDITMSGGSIADAAPVTDSDPTPVVDAVPATAATTTATTEGFSSNNIKTVNITDSFPLQKWTHIIVNADNQYFDFYLDGKLVKSIRAHATESKSTPKIPSKDTKMNLGNNAPFDAHITRFYHWDQPINPHTAWKTYMAGNGQSTLTNVTNSYNVNLHVLKDNLEYTKFQLI